MGETYFSPCCERERRGKFTLARGRVGGRGAYPMCTHSLLLHQPLLSFSAKAAIVERPATGEP